MSIIHYMKSSYGTLDDVLGISSGRRKEGGGESGDEDFEDFPELQGKMAQSREQLTIDNNMTKSDNSIFRKPSGCYLSRGKAFGVTTLFLLGAVAVAFITHQITKDKLGEMCSLNGNESPEDAEGGHSHSPKVRDVRLPRNVIPNYYKVELIPYPEEKENFTIDGKVWVDIVCIEETNKITIHMKHLVIDEESVELHEKGRSNNQWHVTEQVYDEPREFYNITFTRTLEVGHNYTLYIKFKGELNDDLAGFYRSSYIDKATNEKRWVGVTQFQPTDARRAFPCFDEPELKAEFEVILGRKSSMSTISNMDLKKTLPIPGMEGWVFDHYNKSVPMSTYLVAFVVSDFENRVSNSSLSKPMYRVWARKDAIEQAEYARDIGPKILTHFEDYFEIDFPLPKQDMIALPDFNAGAMENWGLITYRETAMLYDEKESSDLSKLRVATVIAHELAHQWFGNLVTPKWWDDLWLNEGFASYVEYIGVDFIEPEWKILEQFAIDEIQSVFSLDALDSSHPISVEVHHPDEINEIFDRISYGKGASIIRMMNHFLTEKSFKRGLTNYLNKWRYSSTKQDNLWEALTQVAHDDHTLDRTFTVGEIMDTWTLQKGFPVIQVDRNYPGKHAVFTQTKFSLIKNETNAKEYENYKWFVPISYASKVFNSNFSKTEPQFWLTNKEKSVDQYVNVNKTEWMIVNVQQTGYYRVNYDQKNWQLITEQLLSEPNVISTVNRAQLLDDALNLARAELLDYDTAFNISMYLKNDNEYLPWESFLNAFSYISVMLSKSPSYGTFRRYMLDLIEKQYQDVGFAENASDPLLKKFHRINILNWACSFGHKECISNAKELYSTWMNKTDPSNDNPVPPNIRRLVYCTAIKHGGESEWDFAWQRYLSSNVGSAKTTILSALACSKETWILNRYLNWSMTADSGIRKQDGSIVFKGVASNEIGNFLAFNFLRDRWIYIKKYFGSSFFNIGNIIKSIANRLNSPFDLQEMEKFRIKFGNDLGAAKRAVDQSIEGVSANVKWMDNNYKSISKWLTKSTSKSSN